MDDPHTKLSLYKSYIEILEHLLVAEGSMPIEDRNYNQDWIKQRQWLLKARESLANLIRN